MGVGTERHGADERHTPHTSGVTTALLLTHVETCGGADAVAEVLARIGKPDREAALRDESTWWAWETKIALFEAAAEVLGDPEVTRTAGSGAIEANVAAPLKAALRALGSPGVVYGNIVRANHKFSTSSRMVLEDLGVHRAVIRYELVEKELEPHRLDCLYNQGLLSCVPVLFDLPPARIEHSVCALRGGAHCSYEVTWQPRTRSSWLTVGATSAGAAAVAAGTAAIAGPLAPVAVGAAVGAGALVAARRRQALTRAIRDAERRLDVQAEHGERVRASLHALTSALDAGDLGARVCEHASSALGGPDVVLLLLDGDGDLRAERNRVIDERVLSALECWASKAGAVEQTVELHDLGDVPGLADLPARRPPVASLCAAPLRSRDQPMGALVALAPRPHSFLPQDSAVLALFAEQASIALANARLYAAQQHMATRDPLTALRNHREFHEAVSTEIARSRRTAERFSVALLDLDGFKAVNDRSGHAAGDRLLAKVGAALARAGRQADDVFRVGGDEFAVLLPLAEPRQARTAATRLARAATAVDNRIGVSWGIATWPDDGQDKAELLARADARLYAMKGGRRVRRTRRRPARRRGRPVRMR